MKKNVGFKRNVILINSVVSNVSNMQVSFIENEEDLASSRVIKTVKENSGEVIVMLTKSIDDAILNSYQKRVGIINMDIVGSELCALEGAKQTILRDKPCLAVCVYHKKDDLIKIPQYIKSLVPEYKFHLRLYNQCLTELILYGVC